MQPSVSLQPVTTKRSRRRVLALSGAAVIVAAGAWLQVSGARNLLRFFRAQAMDGSVPVERLDQLLDLVELLASPGFDLLDAERLFGPLDTIGSARGTTPAFARADIELWQGTDQGSSRSAGIRRVRVGLTRTVMVRWADVVDALGAEREHDLEPDNFTALPVHRFAQTASGVRADIELAGRSGDEATGEIEAISVSRMPERVGGCSL